MARRPAAPTGAAEAKAVAATSGQVLSPPAVGPGGSTQLPTAGALANSAMSFGSLPQITYGMEFGDIGSQGLRAYSGYIREEFLPQLQGRQGAQKYREMMDNSPVIGAIMFAIRSTMRKVEWRVNPADDSPEAEEAAEFVESCMDDMSHPWTDLVDENLSMLGYGYAPHEIVYKKRLGRRPGIGPNGKELPKSKYDDGLISWRRIPIRGQDTVLKWFFDENGNVAGMTQQPWTGPLIDIPIEKMLLFRNNIYKGNPESRSILRNCWRPYWFVKRLEEQEAIRFERLNGFPIVRVPNVLLQAAQAGDGQAVASLNAFKKMATNVRVDEQMGAVLPSDTWEGANGPSTALMYDLTFAAPQSSGKGSVSAHETINRYSDQMLMSVLADFISMGHTQRGAQNLGETKTDMFYQAIEGFLNGNASVYNRYAIPRLWDLNGLDPDLAPEIVPDLAQRTDLDLLGNFVLRMSQAGMPLFPDDDLQAVLRDAAGLPDVTDPRATDALVTNLDAQAAAAQSAQNEADAPPTDLQKIIKASLVRRMVKGSCGHTHVVTKRARRGRKVAK